MGITLSHTCPVLYTYDTVRTADLKVPYYTVFHQFHIAVRGPTTLYSICIASNPFVVEFQLPKSRSTELYSEQAVSVPAPLNANELCLSTPTWPCGLHHPEGEEAALLGVAYANIYSGCNAMACRDFFVQPNQFDPELDPEGEAPFQNTDYVAAAGSFRMVSVSE